jgi:hypothetical protein
MEEKKEEAAVGMEKQKETCSGPLEYIKEPMASDRLSVRLESSRA